MRDIIFDLSVTGYYFKDLITQRTSHCCGVHFIYEKGIIDPNTNRWTINRHCSMCNEVE